MKVLIYAIIICWDYFEFSIGVTIFALRLVESNALAVSAEKPGAA